MYNHTWEYPYFSNRICTASTDSSQVSLCNNWCYETEINEYITYVAVQTKSPQYCSCCSFPPLPPILLHRENMVRKAVGMSTASWSMDGTLMLFQILRTPTTPTSKRYGGELCSMCEFCSNMCISIHIWSIFASRLTKTMTYDFFWR